MVENLKAIRNDDIINALTAVTDPEIPVLSIMDMGIIRDISLDNDKVHIKITPTYTGCPAMDTIAIDIKSAINHVGYHCDVELVLSPAWTTDWITEEGRQKLEKYGIASPLSEEKDKQALLGKRVVTCPQCQSTETVMISQFGSTACKALFKCESCLEPFDYFKCLK